VKRWTRRIAALAVLGAGALVLPWGRMAVRAKLTGRVGVGILGA